MFFSRVLFSAVLLVTIVASGCREEEHAVSAAFHAATGEVDLAPHNAFLDLFEAMYRPIAANHGGELVVHRRFDSTKVDASAQRFRDGPWELTFHGGLVREERLTFDAFVLAVCHEAGHHFGGFPMRSEWGATEGQADYFATQSCTRAMWRDDHEGNAAARTNVDPHAKTKCDSVWDGEPDRNLCYRNMSAALVLMNYLGGGQKVAFDTPSRDSVAKTKKFYPTMQCRLDTMVAGALCARDLDPAVIPSTQAEAAANSCLDAEPSVGDRPICWFKRVDENEI